MVIQLLSLADTFNRAKSINFKKINDCIKEIKKYDKDTQVNSSMIKYLCDNNLISCMSVKSTKLIDYDNLIDYLSMGYEYNQSLTEPRIRTISKLVEFYKKSGFKYVNYVFIKNLCDDKKISFFKVNTRYYINIDVLEKYLYPDDEFDDEWEE